MKLKLRADEANGTHTKFTVFVNGANAGQLCMTEDEAGSFHQIVSHGCSKVVDEFEATGAWFVERNICPHCGRDNTGYPGDCTSDDCPGNKGRT